jgi:hypothetical protein
MYIIVVNETTRLTTTEAEKCADRAENFTKFSNNLSFCLPVDASFLETMFQALGWPPSRP